jgi:hypothetical protein
VPPTVAIEFAINRSSAGTSRGTTAEAAASWNRLIDRIASAPRKNGTATWIGSNSSSGTNATFNSGAIDRIARRGHRSMKTPTNGPSSVNGAIVTSVVRSRPFAVFCCSALKTTEAVRATRKMPSPPWPSSRIHSSLRKSSARSAVRTRTTVPGCEVGGMPAAYEPPSVPPRDERDSARPGIGPRAVGSVRR